MKPTARIRICSPVKAKGDVRLRRYYQHPVRVCFMDIQLQHGFILFVEFAGYTAFSTWFSTAQVFTDEDRNDGRGAFRRRGGDRCPRWRWMHATGRHNHKMALMVFTKKARNMRLFFGVLPGASRFTPVSVAMLQLFVPTSVDAGEWFFMQQAFPIRAFCHAPCIHHQGIVVNREVDLFKYRSALKLRRATSLCRGADGDASL